MTRWPWLRKTILVFRKCKNFDVENVNQLPYATRIDYWYHDTAVQVRLPQPLARAVDGRALIPARCSPVITAPDRRRKTTERRRTTATHNDSVSFAILFKVSSTTY